MEATPWATLQRVLGAAAREQFRGVDEPGLGSRIAAAVREIDEKGQAGKAGPEFAQFEADARAFEQLGRHDRSLAVARGLRLCMAAATDAAPEKRRRSRTRRGDLPRVKTTQLGGPNGTGTKTRGGTTTGTGTESRGGTKAGEGTKAGADARAGAAVEPTSVLPGVGPKTAEKLARYGLETVGDLAYLIPRRYRDLRQRQRFEAVEEGTTAVGEAVIKSFRQGWFRGRYHARLDVQQDHPGAPTIELRWFHPVGGLAQRVETGKRVIVVGELKTFRGKKSIVHPELFDPDKGAPAIDVAYPRTEGVGQRTVGRMCKAALARLRERPPPEVLPAAIRTRWKLPTVLDALELLHDPPEALSPAEVEELGAASSVGHRRLAFEELFLLQLELLRRRKEYQSAPCSVAALPDSAFDDEQLRASLPFEPTRAQWRVIHELRRDLGLRQAMLRLVQGDVGSGKTVVAFAVAVAVVQSGSQVAIMAPTEILAEQHYRTLAPWCKKAGLSVAVLTGGMARAKRASLLALLGAGKIDLLIGTHALLVDDVGFASLGLVVVDEQHRFGVEQRSVLRQKGGAPHLVVMTATPIPRSLALTAFGELDVSVVDELPPGRRPTTTRVFAGARSLGSARTALCDAVKKGAAAYVVCPLVEASEALNVTDVEAAAKDMRVRLPDVAVGVVHGRMAPAEKEAVLAAFRDGELRVLVATTVIEVGLDVPDASAILIEHAERFGLATLHQLRGRVGRGETASLCLLHTAQGRDSEAGARLQILEQTSDGFVVAERDLEGRGPGEVFGTQQSGMPRLRFAQFNAGGLQLLQNARDEAQTLLASDPALSEHPDLREAVGRQASRRPIIAGESG